MSREANYQSAKNQLLLLRMIMESYYGLLSFSDIQEKLEISEKTLGRYLKVFQEIFPDYLSIKRGEELGRQPDKERFLVFNRFELESRTGYQLAPLYLSRFFMSFLEGTLLDESLSDAVTLFESTVDSGGPKKKAGSISQKFYAVGFGPKSYAEHDDTIDTVMQSLIRQNPVVIEYQKSPSAETTTYDLEPLTLVMYKQGLYLIASKRGTESLQPQFFAIERVLDCKRLKDEVFEYPHDYDPASLSSSSFGIFQGELTTVRLRFPAEIARKFIEPRRWTNDQVIEFQGEWAILELKVTGTQELFSWILGFGKQVEILEPAGLREELKNEIAMMAKRYE